MYNNDVGKKSAQKIMKQTGDLKAAALRSVFKTTLHPGPLQGESSKTSNPF
jgi:hypothetical protein